MKGKISGSRIFPSTATQCSEEIGSFFSLRAVERLWGENSSSFQILQEGFGGKFSSRGNIRSGHTHLNYFSISNIAPAKVQETLPTCIEVLYEITEIIDILHKRIKTRLKCLCKDDNYLQMGF